jgi:RimJ/RimL family protein N-acetyltransferase
LFKGGFPLLAPDEMLLEGAFTLEAFRGQRIMPEAMSKIAEKGMDFEARRIYTFVGADNIPSLKGCKRSGFIPYSIRTDRWRLFRRSLEFAKLPAGTPYPFGKKEQVPVLTHA